MDYMGDWDGWQVFKNSTGDFEGYKKTGRKIQLDEKHTINSDSKRVVTNAKNMGDFIKFMQGTKKKEPKIKVVPLPTLFIDESNNPL